MTAFLSKILPIIMIFFLGYGLKKIKIFTIEYGDKLLLVNFYVTLPALTFLSVSRSVLDPRYLYLPLIAIATVFISYIPARIFGKVVPMSRKTLGTFFIGIMIMNTGFTMPFVVAAFGGEGLAIYTFFDFGNTLLIFTFIYYQAVRYGNHPDHKIKFRKFLLLPPMWGFVAGLIVNFSGLQLPETLLNFFDLIGKPTVFLMMLSLGIYFTPKINNLGRVALVLAIRIGLGLAVGVLFTSLFHLDGMLRTLVIIFCGAPVGYNTLVFSSLENLDKEFAASIVSISLLLGIIYIPVLLIIL